MNQDFNRIFSRKNTLLLLLQLSPYFIKHFIFQPYKNNRAKPKAFSLSKQHRKRFHTALIDSVLNIALAGYEEITGNKIINATGKMLHCLMELTKQFDEFIDNHRGTNDSLKLPDVVSIPEIQDQVKLFRDYLKSYGHEDEIIEYIRNLFGIHYEHYIGLLNDDVSSKSFANTLEICKLDGGNSLAYSMEIVRLFNNHPPIKKMQEEFFLLGTAGKFVDDIGDIFSDIKRNHLNLFCSLVNDNPAEKDILYKAVNDNVKINFSWLDQHCHSTFVEYIRKMESFNSRITSKKLRLVFELSVLPAMWGIHLDSEHIAAG
ncbi:MAG: hypothetical protein C4539_03915 [Ignavibacteriales bacterium]|nr:MAG: hypothetical protein C4539_03915 [Ignavibacteriales bacterium]